MNKIAECQWLGTEQQGPQYRCMCTQPLAPGRSYCEEHLWRVYQKGTAVTRRKDIHTANRVWDIESAFNEAVRELEEAGEI